MKAEEIALKTVDALGYDLFDVSPNELAVKVVQALREAGLLLDWKTAMENAPEGEWMLIRHPDMKERTGRSWLCARLDRGDWWCPEFWDTNPTEACEEPDPQPTAYAIISTEGVE